mgnify:CR=1 FL=1
MNRIASLTIAVVSALAAVLVGAFLTATPAGEVPTATASPAVSVNGLDSDGRYVGDGADDDSLAGDGPAVPVTPAGGAVVPAGGAVPASDGGGEAPLVGAVPASDGGADAPASAVPASDGGGEGAVTSGDGFDPMADALPADAPRVCVILDMGAAACESFVNPAPGEVSVAVIYSDDDEHAIVETIAYDENGPIDYVDFWEGETTPSE